MRCVALAASLLVVVAAPLSAQVVSDFASYRRPVTTEFEATVGIPVTSGDLDFYEAFGATTRDVLGTWGTDIAQDPRAQNVPTNLGPTAATMFGTQGVEIDVVARGDDPINLQKTFNLYSIDVAHLFSTAYTGSGLSAISLQFFGTYGDGRAGTITQTFTIPVPALVGGVRNPVLTTLTFDSRWRTLNNVWWNQAFSLASSHQFTNVVAQVTPEPGTAVLVATALGGLALVRMRRRRDRASSRLSSRV